MALPNTKVEIAFNAGYSTPAASRTWTDVSTYVEGSLTISDVRGRQDEVSQISPSTLSLTFNNKDGRFTPELASGAYYPNVKKGRPIRVTSTYNAVSYVRFLGYINDWQPAWPDETDAASTCVVTASSRTARLGITAPLRSVLEQEILVDSPLAYYTLGEPSGAAQALDSSGNQSPSLVPTGTGTAVSFGSIAGPTTSTSTAASFSSGQYLGEAPRTDKLSSFTLECFFATTATSGGLAGLWTVPDVGGSVLWLHITAAGKLAVGAGVDNIVSTASVNNGQIHHGAFTYDFVGGTLTLYLDGASQGSTAFGAGIAISRRVVAGAILAGGVASELLTGSVSHIALTGSVLSAGRVAAHSQAGTSGFASETPGGRLARYASYAKVAETSFDTGVSSIAHVDITGSTAIAAMQKVAEADNGVLFDAKDGTLTYRSRTARYNVASSFTLDATAQEVESDLSPKLDDQFLVNDVSVTGSGGVSAYVTDATSTGDYGLYHQDLDVPLVSSNDVLALAQWRVALGKTPRMRYSTVKVDIVNSSTSQAANVLNADIGTRFGLSNLPSQAPASTADLFVEGYSESITATSHTITFNTSPTYGYAGANGVWQLDVNNIDGPYVLAP